MSEQKTKELPYGVSDFKTIREQNLYFVDKSQYIVSIEKQPRFLLLIRPRRFGKSLFLSMLTAYYDASECENFDRLFGDLWIGQHPTPLHNSFQVLNLDFSMVSGNIDNLKDSFEEHCNIQLWDFMQRYSHCYSESFRNEYASVKSALGRIAMLAIEAKRQRYHLFLIIDEYDNFTNIVLNEQGKGRYHDLTHASGFYRDAFKRFKGTFERVLMMGVSPVTVDDLSSGYNISTNISTLPEFNAMLGFTETEVRTMVDYYKAAGAIKAETSDLMAEMKPWYDNYCFSRKSYELHDDKMFNSDMVLYYLHSYIINQDYPESMLDANTRTDYAKMKRLVNLGTLDNDHKTIISEIAMGKPILTDVALSFPAEQIPMNDKFPSLLFYYGMLTITGVSGSRVVLGIPNNNVRKQYYEYILDNYQSENPVSVNELADGFDDMAIRGDARPALEFIAKAYKHQSSVRNAIEGERGIQNYLMAYLGLCNYYLTSPEMELNHGYCDFFLMPRLSVYKMVAHSYIIELKYLSAKDFDARHEAQWAEAVEQIHRYADSPRVTELSHATKLHLIVMQYRAWDMVRMEEV